MKFDITTLLFILVVVVLVIVASQRCTFKCGFFEGFGQDASIRAQSGWIAGPKGMYGYDPIDDFSKQIEEMKERKRTRLSELANITERGSVEDYSGKHYPYTLDRHCNHQPDCLEGEQCLAGTCVPTDIEAYQELYSLEKAPGCASCNSCM